jgi:hypothetical protein
MAAMSGEWLRRKVRHPWEGGQDRLNMYFATLELALISGIACLGLGLAWAHEADFFAICFAAAAAIAIVEAVRRSV